MKQLILASSNAHKIEEIQAILGQEYKVLGINDLKEKIVIVEDGQSYKDNALIKARAIAKYYDSYILADDSGLEIFALPEILGIYSARYLGEGTSYSDRFIEIFKLLENKEDKRARFVCGLVLITPDKKEYYLEGEIRGRIDKAQGLGGFGYDPIFYPDGYDCSIATISSEEKNEISHRGVAMKKLKQLLKEIA